MKKDIYNSTCEKFFFAPATGIYLNGHAFSKVCDLSEEGSDFINSLLELSEFQLVSKFMDVIASKEKSKSFINEYTTCFLSENDMHAVYQSQAMISLPYNKTVRNTLIRSYQK